MGNKKLTIRLPAISRPIKPLPRHALVPEPTANQLPAWNSPISTIHSLAARWKSWFRTSDHIASKWAAQAPTFHLDVDFNELASAPKNTPAALKKAQDKIDGMKDWLADACSGRWVDRNGKLLVAYFADHFVSHTAYIILF
jgi:hypothetical protein